MAQSVHKHGRQVGDLLALLGSRMVPNLSYLLTCYRIGDKPGS